jgi:hypothetical protein
LKGADLYAHKLTGKYNREDFHHHPSDYVSKFGPYTTETDILMNGVYWDHDIPRLFNKEDVRDPFFRIQTISDITDDANGSVPINLGDQTIPDPVYGVDRQTLAKTPAFQDGSIDVVAVGNLPNELPRDASRYFGEQLIKFVFPDLLGLNPGGDIIRRATMVKQGEITEHFAYMREYGGR